MQPLINRVAVPDSVLLHMLTQEGRDEAKRLAIFFGDNPDLFETLATWGHANCYVPAQTDREGAVNEGKRAHHLEILGMVQCGQMTFDDLKQELVSRKMIEGNQNAVNRDNG